MRRGFSRMKLHCFDRTFFHSSHSLNSIELPASMDTHLWYVKPSEVKSESLLKQYSDILSPSERENVLRLQGEELRKSALLARALVRTTIARYQMNSQVDPGSLKFRRNMHGKPEVCWSSLDDWDPPPLHFNLSHTSSLIACGVTINSQIGIDVEEKHRITKHNTLSLAQRYFSKYEVQVLAAISDPQVQRREFVKLWTLKEAYVKALGKGFSGAPFKTFTIRFKGAREGEFSAFEDSSNKACKIVVESLDDPSDATSSWQFSLLELAGSHYAAICTENPKVLDGVTPRYSNYSKSQNNQMHNKLFFAGKTNVPGKLMVWKTIPFLEDEYVSGTDAVQTIYGLQ